MVYRALYRKYRPLKFEDVIGQEHVVETIKNQISNGKISHAYMFTGTRGTGKTTCAKILARAVNCENPKNGDPCNECETCKGILSGSLLDVIEIDAASNNGVDNIRELREDVIFTPAMAKYKVYIIDEVHMLSMQAFNALLKTLEEPPLHVIFVFATTEIQKVPQTILSRCQRFDFKRIVSDDIKNRLSYVCKQENITIDEKALMLISRLADGAMRDALSILDRCITSTSNISLEIVEKTVGLCTYEEISAALNAVADEDTEAVLNFYSNCKRNSKDSISLFSELCSYYRDMIIVKLADKPARFLNYDEIQLENIKAVASKYTLEKIVRCIYILQNGIYDISKFKDKHIMAEITLIKLTNSQIGCDLEDLNARLSKLEVLGVNSITKPIEKVESVTSSKEVKSVKNQDIRKKSNCDFWDKVLEILPLIGGKVLSAFLKNITAIEDNDCIVLQCSVNDVAYKLINTTENIEILKNAALKASGKNFEIRFCEPNKVSRTNDEFSELLNNANDILIKE